MCQPGRPRPPRSSPGRGLGLGLLVALPQCEVARVPLATGVGVLRGLHVVDLLPGQLAVRRPGLHLEVDVTRAVLGGVRVAAVDQERDQLEHLRDVPGGRGLVGGRQHVQRVVGLVQLALHVVGEVVPGTTLLGGLDQDLVVDVGDVPDERDVVPGDQQPAPQHVEVHRRPHMAHVRLRLNRQATHVDADPALLERDEVADRARSGVVEPEGHAAILGRDHRASSVVTGVVTGSGGFPRSRGKPSLPVRCNAREVQVSLGTVGNH